LRGCRRGQPREQKSDESQPGRAIPEAHEKVYRGRENAENEDEKKEQDRATDYMKARLCELEAGR